jgi:DNA mismatch repair ATPase MutL
MKQKPAFIINVILPPHCYDINLSPDKREVIFTHTDEIISALYDYVDALYSPSRFTFQLSQGVQKQNSMAEFSWGSLPTATASSRQSSHTLLNDAEECDDAADQAEESCQNQEDFTEEQSNAKEDEVGTFEKSVTASTRLNDRIRQRSALLEKLVKPAVIHTIAENIGKKSPSSNNRRDLSASSLQNDLMSDECIFETDSLNETTLSDDEEKPMALSLVGQSSPFFHATSSNNVSVSNHQCQLEKISNGIIWNIMNQDEIITKHQHLLSKKRKVLEVDSSSRNRQKVSCNTSLREITEFHDSGSLHQSNDKVIQHEKLKTITNVDNTVTMLATDSANELLMDMSARVLTKDVRALVRYDLFRLSNSYRYPSNNGYRYLSRTSE